MLVVQKLHVDQRLIHCNCYQKLRDEQRRLEAGLLVSKLRPFGPQKILDGKHEDPYFEEHPLARGTNNFSHDHRLSIWTPLRLLQYNIKFRFSIVFTITMRGSWMIRMRILILKNILWHGEKIAFTMIIGYQFGRTYKIRQLKTENKVYAKLPSVVAANSISGRVSGTGGG